MNTLNSKVGLYLLLSYAVSWLFWIPLLLNARLGTELPLLPGQFYLASFGPLLGAVLTSLVFGGTKGVSDWFKKAYSLRFPKRWLAAAALMPVGYALVGIVAHRLVVGEWPDLSRFGLTEKLPGFTVWQTALVWVLTFGLGEESGWRGFLLPELNQRFSLRISALLVALVWIFWHLPAFFFNPTYVNMGPGILGWAISLAFGSVLLAWLCSSSAFSVVPVLIWHGGFDLITASDQAAEVMAMACSMLVILQGIWLIRRMARQENGRKFG